MIMNDLEQAVLANGWTEAASDRDIFGHYRSAAWRNADGTQILHATACREPERTRLVETVWVSTTDPLGWAADGIDQWSEAAGDLDDAIAHIQQN